MAIIDKTPYEILGVSENIDYGELRAVYRTKIHEHLQKKISPINFRRVCRAYETLSDFDKRKLYDSSDHKQWISELPLDKYTPQQLAAEPDLIRNLKQRLCNATLTLINSQNPISGHTTLYCAARAGNVAAVKFLTEHGAEPDLSQRTKSTALHVAAFYGHADVVRCLLESGADYRIVNAMNNTAESEAFNDDVRRIFAELKQSAYVRVAANELEWFYENGLTQHQDTEYFAQRQTLLHCASKKGHFNIVQWLVEQRSANIDLVDFNGNSALHLAAYGGYRIIVDYLLNRGCDSTLRNRWGTTAEEEGSKHGQTITDLFNSMREHDMFAMARNGTDWWFYYYFDDKLKDMIDSNGISLLYHACRHGQYSVAKWLLEHGANVNIQMASKPRSTSLHGAKFRGHLSIVELLLEYGADVNIKNDYGATVFDEEVSDEVDTVLSNKIKEYLLQYKSNLKSAKLIDINIYEDDDTGSEPLVRIKLGLEAKYKDLLLALSSISDNQYSYFSIARRALYFEDDQTTIISAVGNARYTSSKLINTPICLTGHKTTLDKTRHQSTRPVCQLEPRKLVSMFKEQNTDVFVLKGSFTDQQTFRSGNLTFTFSADCVKDDLKFEVTTLCPSDTVKYGLSGVICYFKITVHNSKTSDSLFVSPTVSITNLSNARLYTLAMPSPYWFSSDTRPNQLSMIDGIHVFIHHVDIIPSLLTLPPDMFIAAALGQPLTSRTHPVSCTCLSLREQDTRIFPFVAYHGTNINFVRSILLDGLVVPGTVVSCGKRINPPSNHFARETAYFGVHDFAAAIFLSPSIYYSSDPTYATTFSDGKRQLIPVLECSVKSGSYDTYPGTVGAYTNQPGDNINALEWRVKDPANIEINAVLFITKIDSIFVSRMARISTITPSDKYFTS